MLRWQGGPDRESHHADPKRVANNFVCMNESNQILDLATKLAALRVAPSVVCLKSNIGDKPLNICSGTIIECEEIGGIFLGSIVTAATLISCTDEIPNVKVQVYLSDGKLLDGKVQNCDFHYNVAIVQIKSSTQLPVAFIGHLDFTVKRRPGKVSNHGKVATSSGHPHDYGPAYACPFVISAGKIVPVIALGRYCEEPYHIMAAPGIIISKPSPSGRNGLFKTGCVISEDGVGGPLINRCGEVIGMNFYHLDPMSIYRLCCSPALPINLVFKCFERLKKCSSDPQPWIGTNINLKGLDSMQKINQWTQGFVKGVLVEKVEPNSPAYHAGICTKDAIIQCGGNFVGSPSELVESLWKKKGGKVEMLIFRPSIDGFVKLSLDSAGIHPDQYGWQVQEWRSSDEISEIIGKRVRLDVA